MTAPAPRRVHRIRPPRTADRGAFPVHGPRVGRVLSGPDALAQALQALAAARARLAARDG